MTRIKLSECGIENLKQFDWVQYFAYNYAHLLPLDFSRNNELSNEEIELITPSIKAFQIGEGSEGKHLKKVVKKFADKTNDPEYEEIMNRFIAEENRHSHTLKKYMELYHIETEKSLWIDQVFRVLRKLTGLECEIIVLVTVEMIALSYYTALSNATDSVLLKTICQQMLNDELKHVVLQSNTLHRISEHRKHAINRAVRILRKLLMKATCFVVWRKYKDLFVKGEYPYRRLQKDSLEYLQESIYIEKTEASCSNAKSLENQGFFDFDCQS